MPQSTDARDAVLKPAAVFHPKIPATLRGYDISTFLSVLADLTVAIGAGVAVGLMLCGAPKSDWQAPDG